MENCFRLRILTPEAGTSDNFVWGKPAESQPISKLDWISEVRWPALVKFQMTEVSASGQLRISYLVRGMIALQNRFRFL